MFLNIIKDIIPIHAFHRTGKKLRKIRGVTVHTTANYRANAGAQSHANYFKSMLDPNHPQSKSYIGYHWFVDDICAINMIPTDEVAWTNGDGVNGMGNNETVSIEMCVNTGRDSLKCLENTAYLIAYQLNEMGFKRVLDGHDNKDKGNVFQHNTWATWKNCPDYFRPKYETDKQFPDRKYLTDKERELAKGDMWQVLLDKAQSYLDEIQGRNTGDESVENKYYKINKIFNDGKWNATQKGAFAFTEAGLKEAIQFHKDNALSEEYKIFDPDGNVIYPVTNVDIGLEDALETIKHLEEDIEVYKNKCKEYKEKIDAFKAENDMLKDKLIQIRKIAE